MQRDAPGARTADFGEGAQPTGSDEAVLVGEAGETRPTAHAKLPIRLMQVRLDSAFGDREPLSDLGVRDTKSAEPDDLQLALT